MMVIGAAWLLMTPHPVSANEPLMLVPGKSQHNLAGYVSLFEDPSGTSTLEEVSSKPSRFSPITAEAINPGLSNSKFWLRVPLKNRDSEPSSWTLSTRLIRLDTLKVHKLNGDNSELIYETGFHSTFEERLIPSPQIYVPFELGPAESAELYLEYQSQGITNMNLAVLDQQTLHLEIRNKTIFDFFIAAFLIALACVNLFHYFAVRRRAYLYYSLLMLSSVAAMLHVMNYSFVFIFGEVPNMVRYFTPVVMSVSAALAMLFTRNFFELEKLNHVLYRLSNLCLMLVFIPVIAMWFLPFGTILNVMSLSCMPTIVLMAFTGVYALKEKVPSAKFYVFAWVIYGLGLSYLALSLLGVQMGDFTGFQIAQVSTALEGLILSMALAHQIRLLNRSHQKSQAELIDSLQRNNKVQRELVDAERAKLQAMMETQQKSQQLATTSHDFAQPIQSLRASLEGLKRNSDSANITQHIDETLAYLQSLSNSLIENEQDRFNALTESIAINEVFVSVFSRYGSLAEEKGLEFFFVPSSIELKANKLILTRLLDNLISNALRYTDHGKVFFGLRRRQSGVEIQVLDSGIGIAADQIDKMTRAYQQSGERNKESMGFGLGLNIVKSICLEAGYQLTVSSTPEQGSKFGILVPTH